MQNLSTIYSHGDCSHVHFINILNQYHCTNTTYVPKILENRQLIIDKPVEFKK